MRRYIAGALLALLVSESSDVALAQTPNNTGILNRFVGALASPRQVLVATAGGSTSIHPRVHHTPLPRRPMANYADPRRYAQMIPKPRGVDKIERIAPPIDLVNLTKEHRVNREMLRGRSAPLIPMRGRFRVSPMTTPTPATTGILPWWTYGTRSIPGVGRALVNVANYNFLVQAGDVNIPEGEIGLTFTRTYNSQSGHNYNNDDGSGRALFGNHWTNNLDTHLGWTQTDQTHGTVSVYTADGARLDYTCTISQPASCQSATPGIFDLLGVTTYSNGTACQFQWTTKSGVSYMFNASYGGCGFGLGSYGRLLAIYGRNQNFYITLTYSWNGGDGDPENLSQIAVTHKPDNTTLDLNFGLIPTTHITELMSIVEPIYNQVIPIVNYHYDTTGNLEDVDKPGNNPVLPAGGSVPAHFLDGNPIPSGNLPETYDVTVQQSSILEVCGPRAAIAIIKNQTSPADGACVDFDYNSSKQLTDWWTRGVLNPSPNDSFSSSAVQTGPTAPPTGWQQWNDTMFLQTISSNCEGQVSNSTAMDDGHGHQVIWCFDSSSRVFQTQTAASSSNWLDTEQEYDSNNNIISTTDARGNKTNIAYDANGNAVEVSLPLQNTSQQSVRPTYLLDYDSYNNLSFYCDPANNPATANSWNPSTSDTLCENSGNTTPTKLTWNKNDSAEPYGCVTDSYSPRSYHRAISYSNGNCGNGLPVEVLGANMQQPIDNSQRQPTEYFSYYSNGTLNTYKPGNTAWRFTYDGLNNVYSVKDPDGVTSYSCYNLDHSASFTETAQQDKLDNNGNGLSCGSGGSATPPPFATAYAYDPDGDVATILRHHNCIAGSCSANKTNSTIKCNTVNVPFGTACNFYDGLDRLVEVQLPYDSSSDLYQNPWITRFLYDLTNNGSVNFHDQQFSSYGNLFQVQELLPSTSTVFVTTPPTPGSVPNSSYIPVKGFAYDGLDRATVKYAASGTGSNYTTETLTWDSTPVNNDNITGLLGQDCNGAASPSPSGQCQQFDYYPDGELKTFQSNDGVSPERDYTYDPDGRPTQVTMVGYSNGQQYTYDPDGNVQTSTDPNTKGLGATTRALLTYHRYLDGMLKSLDVGSGTLNQNALFTYAYRSDGPVQTEAINDSQVGQIQNACTTTLSYTYTDARRLTGRQESGCGNGASTTIAYQGAPATGLVAQETTPQDTLNTFAYSADSELLGMTPQKGTLNCTGPISYGYSLRGELTQSPACPNYTSYTTFLANGVSLHGAPPRQPTQYTWNDLMAVYTQTLNTNCSVNCTSSWYYNDGAGRLTSEQAPYGTQNPTETTAARSYDSENHLVSTQLQINTGSQNEKVYWGPNGRPIMIGTYTGGAQESDERLHWNGNHLLFTTHGGSNEILDDVKVDTQGDIIPGNPTNVGYNGLTFYDRGPGETIVGCHNANGTTYNGFADGYMGYPSTPCVSQSVQMPTNIVWGGTPFPSAGNAMTIGTGGILGMPRTDGFTDGFDTIQGVRSYDSGSGSWTTPDAYGGISQDPASLQSYLWNGNNPVANVDPSGYDDAPAPPTGGSIGQNSDPAAQNFGCSSLPGNSNCVNGQCTSGTVVINGGYCGVNSIPTFQVPMPNEDNILPGSANMAVTLRPDPTLAPRPGTCTLNAGRWICRWADNTVAPIPNVMNTGKYVDCGVKNLGSTILPMSVLGTGVDERFPVSRLLKAVGLGSLGPYAGPAAAVGFSWAQSYTGWFC